MPVVAAPLTDAAAAGTAPPVGLRHRRLVKVVLGLAVALALAAAAGQWAASRETATLADGMRRTIEVHVLGLRGAAQRYSYLPATVAQQPDVLAALRHPADPGLLARANRYLEDVSHRAGADALYVMDADGLTLAASNWNEPQSFIGHNYANRPYFSDARAGRSGLFYGVGQTTGVPGLFMSAPVRVDGQVLGVVAVKVSLSSIAAAWAAARDPIVVTDERGIVVLSSVPGWAYRATRPLTAADETFLCHHQQYGPCGSVKPLDWQAEPAPGEAGYLVRAPAEGGPRHWLALDEALPDLGWTLTVLGDTTSVRDARRTAWALALLALAAAVLTGMYARLRERRLRELRSAGVELERRVAERTAELHEAHAFRKAMEDSLLVGMRARDLEGRILYANRAFCRMLGLREDEVVGTMPPYRFWHPDEIDRQWQLHNAALSGQAPLSGTEHRFRHGEGHDVWAMVYTAPLIDGQGSHTGWMSSVVDITAAKRAEERQRLQNEQLQHAARLASVGEMASTLAHELNQPLAAMSNYAGAARSFAAQQQGAALAECLDGLQAQAARARDILQRLRDMVRKRSTVFGPVALNEVVHNVLALMQPELRRHAVRVQTRLEPALPAVHADRILIEQVLVNLLLNAIQAMAGVPAAQRAVEAQTCAVGDHVRLSVADHGPGVPPHAAGQLFESFFTTKPEGLGLGLNICRSIVESHGGQIAFAPRDGGGAVFSIDLPARR
jgi:two-component system sensor histidine kinase DctS